MFNFEDQSVRNAKSIRFKLIQNIVKFEILSFQCNYVNIDNTNVMEIDDWYVINNDIKIVIIIFLYHYVA